MKKIKFISLILTALLLSACEDIPGQLKVFSDFKVISKGKEKTVSVGEYSTSLDFKKNRIVATIESANGKIKLDFTVPEGVTIPQNGPFELLSSQSGQPFDIRGQNFTKVTRTPEQYDRESCQVEYYETICNDKGCYSVPRYRPGWKTVRYYDEQVERKIDFSSLSLSQKPQTLAQFSGGFSGARRVITQDGPCF